MDIVSAVEILAQHNIIRTNRIIGNYYSIYCPFHNNGNERKASCGVLLHDEYKNGQFYKAGWFHCFTCGHAKSFVDSVDLIFQNNNMPVTGREWLAQNVPDFEEDSELDNLLPTDFMDQIMDRYALQYIKQQTQPAVQYVSEEELASYRFVVPYMYERKLTNEIIAEYDVGYDGNWIPEGRKKPVPCITFPVHDRDGNTLFICRRSIQGKIFHYPKGVAKSMFGIDKIPQGTTSVIVCESCFNALTAVRYGYSAVATLGTGTAHEIQQLKELGVREFVLCFDGDEAGRRATKKFRNALKSVAIVWSIDMPDDKDLNDCTEEEFAELYSKRS